MTVLKGLRVLRSIDNNFISLVLHRALYPHGAQISCIRDSQNWPRSCCENLEESNDGSNGKRVIYGWKTDDEGGTTKDIEKTVEI